MKTRTILLTLLLCVVGAAVCFADDPQIGTWKLNEGKSKIGAGSPKLTTVVYEAAGDSVKVTVDGSDRKGKPTHNTWTGKFDGKDYPVTGDPNSDMRSYTKNDDHTLGSTLRKAARSRLAVAQLNPPTARAARSPSKEPIQRARSSPALRCTTSSRGSHPIPPATAMPLQSFFSTSAWRGRTNVRDRS